MNEISDTSGGRRLHHQICTLCEASCGLLIEAEGDEIRSIKGNPDDVISRGHICPKGVSLQDLHGDPDRLRQPMIRSGAQWRTAPWDEALAHCVERLSEIAGSRGQDAIAAYFGNPCAHNLGLTFHLAPFLAQLGSRNLYSAASVDTFPLQLVCYELYGHQYFHPVPDIDNTDFFLIVGANPMASNGSIMTTPDFPGRARALKARGGRMVLVDPRRTETARVADEHIFIRPGTDAFLLLALVNVLFRDGLVDTGDVGDQVVGLDTVRAAVAPFTPERAAVRTGIAAEAVERLAHSFAAAPSAVCYGRIGLSIQRYGSLCLWAIQLLNLLTGNLDRKGGALLSEPAVAAFASPASAGGFDRWRSRVSGLPELCGTLPVAVLAEEILTPGEGQVRALITIAGNPASSNPNVAKLERALAGLDFMMSIDIYLNETTRHADVILPPASPLERGHYPVYTSSFGVRNFAKYSSPLFLRPEEARHDWEILERLTNGLRRSAEQEPVASMPPEDHLARELAQGFHPSLAFEDLRSTPQGVDLGPLKPSLRGRILTSSGRIEAAPPRVIEDLQRLAAEPDPAAGELLLVGRRNVRSNNSWLHNLPRLMARKPDHHLLMHPDDMQARNIGDGALVSVRSDTGVLNVEAKASTDMMRGSACLPHGWGHDADGVHLTVARGLPGANFNLLCNERDVDRPSNGSSLTAIRVVVTPA